MDDEVFEGPSLFQHFLNPNIIPSPKEGKDACFANVKSEGVILLAP